MPNHKGEEMTTYADIKRHAYELLNHSRRVGSLKAVCEYLHDTIDTYDWVGFYIAEGEELVLGPYVGEPTDHVRIPFGRGICGQAADRKETFIVPDVRLETNYLSCSVKVRSEIVVPILSTRGVLGEIDIDSHTPNGFTDDDRALLEGLADKIAELDIL